MCGAVELNKHLVLVIGSDEANRISGNIIISFKLKNYISMCKIAQPGQLQ